VQEYVNPSSDLDCRAQLRLLGRNRVEQGLRVPAELRDAHRNRCTTLISTLAFSNILQLRRELSSRGVCVPRRKEDVSEAILPYN